MPRLTMAETGEPPPGLQDLIRVWVQLNQKDSHPVGVTVFLELLPRFEQGTSSLPTAVWDEVGRSLTVCGPFRWAAPCSLALFAPLSPPSFIVSWVAVWVRRL